MIPEDLVHGVCRIADRDGRPTPTLGAGEVDGHPGLRGRHSVLHVFAIASEASAFLAGIALTPAAGLLAVQGVEGAERVVLVAGAPRTAAGVPACSVNDHGGLAAARAQALWYGLAGALPDGFCIEFGRDGAHPTFVVGGVRRFGLALHHGWIELRTKFRAGNWAVNTAMSCDLTTSVLMFSCTDRLLKIEMPPGDLLGRLGHIQRVDAILADEESRDVHEQQMRAVRQDPKHCGIVERMLSGWALSSVGGSVCLVPPDFTAGGTRRLQPVTHAALTRLKGAGMIRKPRWVRGRSENRCFHYEVGSLDGTAVRRPEKTS